MPQNGTSLNAISKGGNYTGTAVTPTNPFQRCSMVLSMSGYTADSRLGSTSIDVALQASHDGTNWVTLGMASYGVGQPYVHADFPSLQFRAVIISWGAGVTAGSLTATVAGI